MNNPKISVISPVYGAASLLESLVKNIKDSVSHITEDFEIILVEDCSPDKSWETIRSLSSKDARVKGIRLSRNFGQQNALNAGFDNASGEWIVTLDCDMQDNPSYIKDLYKKGLEGCDIVFACRRNRKDGLIKKIGSRIFYGILGYLTETDQDGSIANYVLYRRRVVDAMKSLGDYYRYYPLISKWVGFNTCKLEIEHSKRTDNIRSSYSMKKRLKLAYATIIAFSDRLLRLVLQFGITVVFFSMFFALFLVARYVIMGTKVSGWMSIFISIWFLSGIMIATLGIIGAYIGKAFETVKHRPTYIVADKTNLK